MTAATQPILVLFVDDIVETVTYQRNTVRDSCQVTTHLCRSINQAVRFIQRRRHEILAVVIDLYMPGDYGLLRDYERTIPGGLKMNQGQLLGAYLRDPGKPGFGLEYRYLTAVSEVMSDATEDENNRKISKDVREINNLIAFIDSCKQGDGTTSRRGGL